MLEDRDGYYNDRTKVRLPPSRAREKMDQGLT